MITTLFAATTFACSLAASPVTGSRAPTGTPAAQDAATSDSVYRALFESGQAFADFVARADHRKEQWEANYALRATPDALVTRARAAGSGWRLLVVTVPGCSDSVNSIPYLASLVDQLPGVEMRLVMRDAGLSVMEAHRTPDGRAATPTVILLDAEYRERGCWIERPAPLIAWLDGQKGKMSDGELFDGKMKWYDDDRGASSLEELVQMMEAAAAGRVFCGSAAPGQG
jgi:hypothetical protein